MDDVRRPRTDFGAGGSHRSLRPPSSQIFADSPRRADAVALGQVGEVLWRGHAAEAREHE